MESRVGTTFGKYNIISLLGKGGMGEVYEAYDTDKNRTVALKILADGLSNDDTFRKRFQRESHAAAVLQEPHVIPIHDWGEIDGRLYIDMRLVHGQTLDELIAKGPMEPSRAVAIIGQIGAALDAAHAEGLLHRDIKPHNIIVTEADFAYLVDFGIAEVRGDTRLTTAGTPIGTISYMAPERFTEAEATPAVDVYALACVLYESLTGDSPFSRDSLENMVAAHLASPPPRAERHQSAGTCDLRRRHRPRHGQGPRRPVRNRGRPRARGAAGGRRRQIHPRHADRRRADRPDGGCARTSPGRARARLASADRRRRRDGADTGRSRRGHRPSGAAERRTAADALAGDRIETGRRRPQPMEMRRFAASYYSNPASRYGRSPCCPRRSSATCRSNRRSSSSARRSVTSWRDRVSGGGPSISTPVWDKVRSSVDGADLGFVPDAWVKTGTAQPQARSCE